MSYNLANTLGLQMVSVDPNNYDLRAANGNKIEIVARTTFRVTLSQAKLVNRTTCTKLPVGLEDKCD